MKKLHLSGLMSLVFITACSNTSDYTPATGESAESIFKAACAECHKNAAPKLFELSTDESNAATIKQIIADGNIVMPKFPNIKGEQLDELVKYIVANSIKE